MNISYNSANQMLTFNDKTITYDDNGNLTSVTNSCGTTTFAWDARNRLVAINGFTAALTSTSTCEALTANFKYDAFGRRIEKSVNGRTIRCVYDRADIVQEIENGVVSANHIRTLNIDEPLARVTPTAVRFYQTDALGSVIGLVDENGTTKTIYNYDPYGNVAISGEQNDNPFQYTARENDGTGLYYYRARYYSPELQRFISEDPIGLSGGINLFAYVANNSVNWVDPRGLKVTLWTRPADLPWPLPLFGEHQWIKTDNYQSGMGMPGNRIPGQDSNSGYPGMPTETVDHTGQSEKPNSREIPIPFLVDEECVNREIAPGQPAGRWLPSVNDCNTWTKEVLEKCRRHGPWWYLPKVK